MAHRRPHARRVAVALVLAAATLTGCGLGSTDCTAVGYSNTRTAELADGWPPVDSGTVRLACAGPCPPEVGDGGPDEWRAPLTGTATAVQLGMTAPESVVVTVADAAGAELARVAADLDWVRVGGSAECGGPSEAAVAVPAP